MVLAGHSWGTNIGVSYAQQYPQNVSAYVGVSQIVNAAEAERRSYAWALGEAKRRNDQVALAELQKIGAPPIPLSYSPLMYDWINKFGGGYYHVNVSVFQLMLQSFRASEMTWYDGITYKAGGEFSRNALARQLTETDWLRSAAKFAVPIFIVAGRFDHSVDATLQHEYFDRIEAPDKHFKWFENSAHCPPFEEPAAFNAFIIREVLPVALKSQRAPVTG